MSKAMTPAELADWWRKATPRPEWERPGYWEQFRPKEEVQDDDTPRADPEVAG